MKRTYTDVKLIEHFREGKLSDEELKAFHKRLLEDTAFAQKVRLQLNITEEIDTFWVNDMMSKFEQWEQDFTQHKAEIETPNQISETMNTNKGIANLEESARKKWFLIGAIVITLIGLAASVWYLSQPKVTVDLFAQNFKPYEDVIEHHNAEDSDLLTLAMGAYGEADYTVALVTLKRFLNEVDSISPENRIAATFYMAVANLGAGNVSTAKQQFGMMATDSENPFQEQAEWYVALANIKMDNMTEAKKYLSKIKSNPNHRHYKQAEELIKALE